MSLSNNTTILEDILATVNALPNTSGGITPNGTKSITANGTYDVTSYATAEVNVSSNSVESVEQATPVITVSSSGLITATATQAAGEVAAGTKSATKQLSTKGATTITPSTSEQTAVSAGTYVTGDIKVAAVSNSGSSGTTNALGAVLDGSATSVYDASITTLRQYALNSCTDLVEISFPALKSMAYRCCANCYSLKTINLPLLESTNEDAFASCSQLEEVNLPALKAVSGYDFYYCSKLVTADFAKVSSIATEGFSGCSALKSLILRNENAVCSLANKNAFDNTPIASGTGYIYVPRALVSNYKTATNWSTYADQIRAIEDYPDITGG